jgi:hypothetical protein
VLQTQLNDLAERKAGFSYRRTGIENRTPLLIGQLTDTLSIVSPSPLPGELLGSRLCFEILPGASFSLAESSQPAVASLWLAELANVSFTGLDGHRETRLKTGKTGAKTGDKLATRIRRLGSFCFLNRSF